MLRTVENLVAATHSMNSGNHRVKSYSNNTREFIYHSTVICTVNDSTRTFNTDNGGWNTQSTTRAINSYKQAFTEKGYTVDSNLPCGYRD